MNTNLEDHNETFAEKTFIFQIMVSAKKQTRIRIFEASDELFYGKFWFAEIIPDGKTLPR